MKEQHTKFKQTEIGMIPEDWEVENLKKNCTLIQYGYTEAASDYPIGPKFLRGTDIRNKIIDWESVPYCKISEEELKKYQLQKGDIVITRMGTPGDSAYFDKDFPVVFASYLIRIRLNQKFFPKFVYYFLQSKFYTQAIKAIISTSATPGVNAHYLTNINIPKPNLNEQTAIAKILSDLDAKIELNQQMNKTLEQIGQAIFKHWFVDFEFPNEEGKPYKSSGGEMVYNEELGKEIPKGWRVGKLGEFIIRNREKLKDKKEWEKEKAIDLSTMPQFSICLSNFQEGKAFDTNIYRLHEMDILFGSIRPYFGKAGFSPINGVVTGTVFSYIPKYQNYYSLILFLTTSKHFIEFTVNCSKGTKMPIIGWGDFCSYTFAIPEEENFVSKFNSIILPLLYTIKNNIQEIQTLSQLRDSLLPKLMTGKIRVPIKNA